MSVLYETLDMLDIDIESVEWLPISSIDAEYDCNYDVTLRESIKRIGVIEPIIVANVDNRLKIISGKQRYCAMVSLGYKVVPVIVRVLTLREQELLRLEVEARHVQESGDFLHLVDSVSRYFNLIKAQGVRSDLTSSPVDQKFDARILTGQVYGISPRTVGRYVKISGLVPNLKLLIQDYELSIRSGVVLAKLTKSEQELVALVSKTLKLRVHLRHAVKLVELARRREILGDDIIKILSTYISRDITVIDVLLRILEDYSLKHLSVTELDSTIRKALDSFMR